MTRADIGQRLGLGRTAIKELLAGPDAPAEVRFNARVIRYWPSEVEAFIERHTATGPLDLTNPAVPPRPAPPVRARGGRPRKHTLSGVF
jgi:hypothetical protein